MWLLLLRAFSIRCPVSAAIMVPCFVLVPSLVGQQKDMPGGPGPGTRARGAQGNPGQGGKGQRGGPGEQYKGRGGGGGGPEGAGARALALWGYPAV